MRIIDGDTCNCKAPQARLLPFAFAIVLSSAELRRQCESVQGSMPGLALQAMATHACADQNCTSKISGTEVFF